MGTVLKRKNMKDDYLDLVRKFPLCTLKTAADHNAALGMVRALAIQPDGSLSSGQREYMDTLVILLEEYDRRHVTLRKARGAELLRRLVEERELTAADLAHKLGVSRPLVVLVLQGKRAISKALLPRLASYFGLPMEVFLEPPN